MGTDANKIGWAITTAAGIVLCLAVAGCTGSKEATEGAKTAQVQVENAARSPGLAAGAKAAAEKAAVDRAAVEKVAEDRAAAEKAAADRAAAEKSVALNAELQPKLLAELKPHMANCKRAADVVKATIRQMRRAVSGGNMDALQRFNDRLGPLGVKVAVAEGGGTKLIDEYQEKGVDVEKIREQFMATCNTDVEEAK